MGRPEDAKRHFERALVMNARMGALPWLAHTQADYGSMLLESDGKRARELLAEAISTYEKLGMSVWADRARGLAGDRSARSTHSMP
jgi:hypothetical protein